MFRRTSPRSARPSRRPLRERPLYLEVLEDRTVLTTLTVGPNINTSQPSLGGNQSETAVAINPTNPNNLFVTSNGQSPNYARYSTDGGITWMPSSWGAGGACCDSQTAWDQFGNLFVVFLTSGLGTSVALSTNGGASFSLLASNLSTNNDQPSIAVGPGGSVAPGSVWVDYWTSDNHQNVRGAPVTGLGSIGAFTAQEKAPGSGQFGGISVGKDGRVSITYEGSNPQNGPVSIFVNTDYDGLGAGGFSSTVSVTTTNVGTFSPITPQPSRSIDAEANLAYDHNNGRLYLVFTDRPTTSSNDTDIFVMYSTDGGATWGPRIKVSDDTSGKSQFNPAIAVDQTTSFVAITWWDCRNSPADNSAQIYGTVSVHRGRSWEPNVQIGAGLSSGIAAGSFNFGDYDLMDYNNGRFYRSWGDNSNPSQITPPNSSTTAMDAATARVDVSVPGPPSFFIRTNLDDADLSSLAGALRSSASTPIVVAPTTATGTQTPAAVVRFGEQAFATKTVNRPEVPGLFPPGTLGHPSVGMSDAVSAHQLQDANLGLNL
jgi:hypothetical protein